MAQNDARYRAPIGSSANGDRLEVDDHSRRHFLSGLAKWGLTTATSGIPWLGRTAKNAKPVGGPPKTFRVWVFSDAHVARDKKFGNDRESLAVALWQSESASGFEWDITLNMGDISGDVGLPKDA